MQKINPGQWCDVAPDVTVHTLGTVVTTDRLGDVRSWPFSSTQPMYVRVAVNGPRTCVALKDGSPIPSAGGTRNLDRVVASVDGEPEQDFGHGHAEHPVAIAAHEDGFIAFTQFSPTQADVWIWKPGAGWRRSQTIDIPHTSQGFWHVKDGRPVLTDDVRDAPDLRYPSEAGGLRAGQRHGGADTFITVWQGQRFVALAGLARYPRVARDSDGTFRVVSTLNDFREWVEIRGVPPFGELESQPSAPPVQPPTPPPPHPSSSTSLQKPGVSITSFATELRDGQPAILEVEDDKNPALGLKIRFELVPVRPGVFSQHVRIQHAGGDNRSSKLRELRVIHPEPSTPGRLEPQPVTPLRPPSALPPIVGLVWPLPGADLVHPSPSWIAEFRKHRFTWARANVPVMRPRENALASVRTLREGGLNVWPILEWPFAHPNAEDLGDYAQWYLGMFPDTEWIELGNEPWIVGENGSKIPADEYLRIASVMAQRIERLNTRTRVVIAMDLFDHNSGESRHWPGVERVIAFINESPRRYAAIHPYRNPNPPEFSPWGSRQKEHEALVAALGHNRYVVTEVGWKPSEGDPQRSGRYHASELEIHAANGVPAVMLYAHISDPAHPEFDFGLWDVDPAANTIAPRPCALSLRSVLPEPAPLAPPPRPPDPTPTDRPSHVIRTDFLTLRGPSGDLLPSGEFAAVSEEMQRTILETLKARGYTGLLMEPVFEGDPTFDFLKNREGWERFGKMLQRVRDGGIEPWILFGFEGCAKAQRDYRPADLPGLVREASPSWRAARRVCIGLEVHEYWKDREIDAIGKAFADAGFEAFVHFNTGIYQPALEWDWCKGVFYQYGNDSPDSTIVDHTRRLAPLFRARGKLFVAGEYSFNVSESTSRGRGALALAAGAHGFATGGPRPEDRLPDLPSAEEIPNDALDPNAVTWDSNHGTINEVRDWPRELRLRGVRVSGGKIRYDFDEPAWSIVNGVRGNLWVIAHRGGKWRAEPFDYFKPNQREKTAQDFGWDGWKPRAGEELYAVVSTTARDKVENGRERSNIVRFHWS